MTQSVEQTIRSRYERLSVGERKLADLVLEMRGELAGYSATELAESAGVSKATASRLVRRLGFSDYQAMRQQARAGAASGSPLAEIGARAPNGRARTPSRSRHRVLDRVAHRNFGRAAPAAPSRSWQGGADLGRRLPQQLRAGALRARAAGAGQARRAAAAGPRPDRRRGSVRARGGRRGAAHRLSPPSARLRRGRADRRRGQGARSFSSATRRSAISTSMPTSPFAASAAGRDCSTLTWRRSVSSTTCAPAWRWPWARLRRSALQRSEELHRQFGDFASCQRQRAARGEAKLAGDMKTISFHLNGDARTIEAWPDEPLLDVLREVFKIKSVKAGCSTAEGLRLLRRADRRTAAGRPARRGSSRCRAARSSRSKASPTTSAASTPTRFRRRPGCNAASAPPASCCASSG